MQKEFHESAPDLKARPLPAQLWRVQRVQKVQAFRKNLFAPGASDSPKLIHINSTLTSH